MNLDQLETSFRADADDKVKPYLWSRDEVVGWLNEAQEQACIRAKLIFEKSDSQICEISVSPSSGSIYEISDAITEIVYATLTDSSGAVYQLGINDSFELDRIKPLWRTTTDRPENIIHRDNSIELDSIPDGDYTLNLEVYRLPSLDMANDDDKPEINRTHHIHLVQWALHRAYQKPDAETLNPQKSAEAEARFTDYFGELPDASMRKDQNSNRPHVNKAYW